MKAATPRELDVLRHALGLSASGRGTPYRRHFVTGVGSVDHETCMQLVRDGRMVRRPPSQITGGDDLFLVTDDGRAVALQQDPAPKLTRSQARYGRFLEADCGLPFGEWLRTPWAGA